jgi:flagellar biosynthesis/type III secretory pathway protein FliH
VIPAAVYDAEREAERIVAEATSRAQELGARARAEAESAGRRQGEIEGVAILARAHAARARLLTETEDDVARLALGIARKIVEAELALNGEAIARIVSSALQSARLGRAVVVRVHPDELASLEASRPTLSAAAGRSEGLVLRPDPSVGRGGCVVESELGTIDARLDTQLDAIERALLGETD